jgi:GNAT superfamily N-acetyltransferase
VIFRFGTFELDDDRGRVDRNAVWEFLSTEAYWARWRERSDVEKQIDTAWRVVGAYESSAGRTVGFARAISDGVSFAYLADVYVAPAARGGGLGVELVRFMLDEGPGRLFRWSLHTRDAHTLYERFGFAPPDSGYLERPGTRPAIGS